MNVYLSITENGYYLDWNNNSLADKPVLVTNSRVGKRWSIFDILLDIVRNLPPKPTAIYIPPITNAKEKILNVYCAWCLNRISDSFINSLDEKIWLDGEPLNLLTHNISDLKMGICTVVNINWK